MTPIAFASSQNLLMQLVNPALRAIAIAASAGIILATLRVKATFARLLTWKSVLCAALAMPVLGWILPALTIPVPALLQPETERVYSGNQPESRHSQASISREPIATTDSSVEASEEFTKAPIRREHQNRPLPVTFIAMGIYLAGAGMLLVRILIGQILGYRLIRSSNAILDPSLATHVARRARWLELKSTPACLESRVVHVPLTIGVLRPKILLPSHWREWDHAKLDAILAHEVSHVARRDGLTQMLSVLHRAIFWFSPLAWWLDRHLADLAEQASDEAALACGADANAYAKTLLGFFETLRVLPGRVWWQGVAMAKAGQAERRLERILAWNKEGASAMYLKRSVTTIIVAVAIPIVLLAASVQSEGRPQETPQVASPPAPAAKPSADVSIANPPLPAAAPEDAPVSAIAPAAPSAISGHGFGFLAPPASPASMAPSAATAPFPPYATWAGQSHASGRSYSYSYGYDDEDRFVIVSGKTDSLTMSGSTQDAHHVEHLRKQIPGDFIWFQRDERSYIIRDQATIDRARSFWAPQEELGKKQEELGKQQEVLGKQQEALGRKMEQVKVDVPDMTASLDKLKAELKALGPTATQNQLGEIQSEIGELQSRIGDVQSHAGDQQSKVGEEMSALGEKQGKLGEQQGELGRQQEKAALEATRKMKELFDEAIKNGKAQPESPSSGGASL